MRACIILHNIIVENESGGSYDLDDYKIVEFSVVAPTITLEALISFTDILQPEVTIHASPNYNQF